MAFRGRTYSFKDTSGAFTHPLVGQFLFAGQIGMHSATVAMLTDKTVQDLAADGTVMVSAIAGNQGSISIEVQQTSALHAFLLAWYNALVAALDVGDVTNWATGALTLRNIVDGSNHEATGVSPTKIPDKPYQQQGQHITWVLTCADIVNVTLGIPA